LLWRFVVGVALPVHRRWQRRPSEWDILGRYLRQMTGHASLRPSLHAWAKFNILCLLLGLSHPPQSHAPPWR
jgi:hypothetical protein